jgi:uncharacterized SAM-binding protein YcdF (DUF218 family)
MPPVNALFAIHAGNRHHQPASETMTTTGNKRQLKRWCGFLVATAVSVAAAAWTVGLVRFAAAIPRTVADTETRTDAIVVLTGGSERIGTGLRLLTQEKAGEVFVSGVHPNVDVGELIRLAGDTGNAVAGHVAAGHGARDTAGNARETAEWMRSRGYGSLRLVTGSYHMPRSLYEFSLALPEAVVIPHPVFPDRVREDDWWRAPGTATLIISEYNKFLLAWLQHAAASSLRGVPTRRRP